MGHPVNNLNNLTNLPTNLLIWLVLLSEQHFHKFLTRHLEQEMASRERLVWMRSEQGLAWDHQLQGYRNVACQEPTGFKNSLLYSLSKIRTSRLTSLRFSFFICNVQVILLVTCQLAVLLQLIDCLSRDVSKIS